MQELNAFRNHAEVAIKRYELKFTHKKISDRRRKDINEIRRIIRASYYNYYDPIKKLKNYLNNNLKTGWTIFQTGNSRLKNEILKEMEEFKKIHIKTLITPTGKIFTQDIEDNKSAYKNNIRCTIFYHSSNVSPSINKKKSENEIIRKVKNNPINKIFSFLR